MQIYAAHILGAFFLEMSTDSRESVDFAAPSKGQGLGEHSQWVNQ